MKQLFLVLSLFVLTIVRTMAQTASPMVTFYDSENETTVEMSGGESQTMPAPLEIKMMANLEDYEGYTARCEWKLYNTRDGESKPLLDRFDENTSYTLLQSGSYGIKLYVMFTDRNGVELEYESEVFTINITESKLSCPDGFSPNGDGINDVFKVTYQSIIKMKGVFFNRWGQKVYSFDLTNVDEGWDGRQGGKYVKDGVYYLNLQATGSDGVKYDIKKAVNVLKGFREYDE